MWRTRIGRTRNATEPLDDRGRDGSLQRGRAPALSRYGRRSGPRVRPRRTSAQAVSQPPRQPWSRFDPQRAARRRNNRPECWTAARTTHDTTKAWSSPTLGGYAKDGGTMPRMGHQVPLVARPLVRHARRATRSICAQKDGRPPGASRNAGGGRRLAALCASRVAYAVVISCRRAWSFAPVSSRSARTRRPHSETAGTG